MAKRDVDCDVIELQLIINHMKYKQQQSQDQNYYFGLKQTKSLGKTHIFHHQITQYEHHNTIKPLPINIYELIKNNQHNIPKQSSKKKRKTKLKICSKIFSQEDHKYKSQIKLKRKQYNDSQKSRGSLSTKNGLIQQPKISRHFNSNMQAQSKLKSLQIVPKMMSLKTVKRKGKTLATANKINSTYETQANKEQEGNRLKMFIEKYKNLNSLKKKKVQQADIQHKQIQNIVKNLIQKEEDDFFDNEESQYIVGQEMKQQKENNFLVKVKIKADKMIQQEQQQQIVGIVQLPNKYRNRFQVKKQINIKSILKDRYKLLEKIGRGLSGQVYKAKDILSDKLVAIKIIRIIKNKPELQYQFYQKIQHQNIVKYYNNFIINKDRYLILEYFPYTLSMISKIKKFDEEEVKHIFKNVVNGILFLHGLSLAHRDIKMENIVVSEDLKTVKFIDFGLCIDSNQLQNNLSKQFCGTISYMPPQILQKRPYNPKDADIWSLGILLYKLMFERYPYRGRDQRQILSKIKGTKLIFPQGCNLQLKRLLQRMLVKNENNRLKINQIAQHEWFN